MPGIWSGIEFAAMACVVIAVVWLMLIQDKIIPTVRSILSRYNANQQITVAPAGPDWGIRPFLTWGLAALLLGSAITLALSQFGVGRILFVLGAIPLVAGFAFAGSASLYPRF